LVPGIWRIAIPIPKSHFFGDGDGDTVWGWRISF